MRTRSLLAPSRATAVLLLLAGGLALAGCGGGESATTTTTAPARTVGPAADQPIVVRIDIKDGKPVGGLRRAAVKKGQKVAIVVNSDVADEVHLHGYDLHSDVDAGGSTRIQFVAGIAGVFEAELESRGLEVLELSVR